MARAGHGLWAGMTHLFGHFFPSRHSGDMNRHYVSDYTRFIDGFLERHPEEVEEQAKGWYIWWDKRIDLDEQAREAAATVPDDGYGFHASARRHEPPPH